MNEWYQANINVKNESKLSIIKRAQSKYYALAAEHEKLSEKIRSVEEQKKDKADRRRKIEIFLQILEEQTECVSFDPYTFVALIDRVIVGQEKTLEFIFRNGMKYEYVVAD